MATRAKYNRVKAPEETKEEKPDTDILMRFSPRYGKYVSRALTLFFGEGKKFVTIKAAERLMDKALWVSQVVRRKVQGLHQIVQVSERKIVDIWEPLEEGLVQVHQERFLTVLEVTLTLNPTAEQLKMPGYHAPLNVKADFLTKETWEKGEQERKEQRVERGERGDRRDGGDRRDREPRERRDRPRRDEREPRQDRGRQRRRGRDRRDN